MGGNHLFLVTVEREGGIPILSVSGHSSGCKKPWYLREELHPTQHFQLIAGSIWAPATE